ncbi:MAG TPA: tail fiber protein [Pyrinomonadaceae bacterium]|nr:tail fiber protein [Pyrinomonadaceae bacterium]
MATPFIAEIKIVSFNFAPRGWAMCNGQFLPINQNQALFSLLGTSFGGNGQTTFALPDMRGRAPLHIGANVVGQKSGEEFHTVNTSEMPAHNHFVQASNSTGDTNLPGGSILANSPAKMYQPPVNLTTLDPTSISNVGGSQAHENRQPFLVLNFVIALVGIFPSRN